MTVYRLSADTSYRCLCWEDESSSSDRKSFDFIKQFWKGRQSQWDPPPLRLATLQEDLESEDEEVAQARFEKGISDCPFYSAACLLFSERARHGLRTFLESAGELMPIRIPGVGTFFAFSCTNVLDALDIEHSSIEFYPSGNPRQVTHFAFHRDVLSGQHVFRMEWPPPFAIYASQTVVEKVNQLELLGIVTEEVK